jgi:hypothetical protein
MSQPVTYDRVYNFTEYQALNPTVPLPAGQVDLELNTIKISLDQTQANLALIQRDDGQIANNSVGFDQLKSELSVGVAPATLWATATNYQVNNPVFHGIQLYRCLISHISGVFATDLAAGKWLLIADFTPPAHTLTNDRLVQRVALSVMGNTSNATADVADIVGTADQVLRVNSAGTALAFGSLDLSKSGTVGASVLPVANGGTGLSASGTNGQLLLGVTGSNPAFGTMSQDVAITNTGVATIQTNVVTNAKAAQMAAATLKGNPTASLANASDFTIQGLTNLAAPHATLDFIPVYDHVSGTIKNATPASVGSAGSVSSIALNTGAFTLSHGLTNSANDLQVDPLFFPNFIGGLGLSNDGGSPNTVLDIAGGACTDSTNSVFIKLGSVFAKSTAAPWAFGTGVGGMGTGLTIANSTWYHVFAIINTSVGDVYFDTSITAANKPVATTAFRRIGSFKTNGSAQIIAFTQVNDDFLWTVPTHDVSGNAIGTTATNLTLNVPTGVVVKAMLTGWVFKSATAGSIAWFYPTFVSDQTVAYATFANVYDASSGGGNSATLAVLTNTSAQIRARGNVVGATVDVTTFGWIDSRGR